MGDAEMIYVLLVFLILLSVCEIPGLIHHRDGKEISVVIGILFLAGVFASEYVLDWDFLPTFTSILSPFKPAGDWFSRYFELVRG